MMAPAVPTQCSGHLGVIFRAAIRSLRFYQLFTTSLRGKEYIVHDENSMAYRFEFGDAGGGHGVFISASTAEIRYQWETSNS
jgi:hypothetical protein